MSMSVSTSEISPRILEHAPRILSEIQKAQSILLHCHPSPDPDSVGSTLAMKFALEGMGKKVTLIKGDSDIPEAFMHFPGAQTIVPKNISEINLTDFDLFIILDSGSIEQVSRIQTPALPLAVNSIVIDHHASNTGFAAINLIETTYPAAAQILFDLFTLWKVEITSDIASNLFIGIYTDTGGFKYDGTTERTFKIVGELIKVIPDFHVLISRMENSNKPSDIAYQALALNSVQSFLDGAIALATVSHTSLLETGIPIKDVRADVVSPILRSVKIWGVTGVLVEVEPSLVKLSFRSKDSSKFDVSRLAVALGGGGHKAAAGAVLKLPLEEATKLVVATAKELYNL